MKNRLMLKKKGLAEKVNLQFDEVAEIFSEETLESIFLMQILGGTNSVASCGCNSVAECGCTVNNNTASCGCSGGSGGRPYTFMCM